MAKAKTTRKPARAADSTDRAADFEQLQVPLSAIVYNPKINARGEELTDIEQLAVTIRKEGLVQPIAVRPAGKKYEAVEGGRRFFAIQHLARIKAPGWTAATLIPVISRRLTDAQALEASIAAHITRLNPSPAQQALSFVSLQKSGQSVEEIAANFGTSVRFVEQRLAIGALPPAILKALKSGDITVDTAEAFTLSRDPAQQLKLFTELTRHGAVNPSAVRLNLLGKAVPATSREARYVGEKAYLAAGGTITADLFGEARFFDDPKILSRLFESELSREEEALHEEGWSFVTVARDHVHDYDGWKKLEPKGKMRTGAKDRVSKIDAEIQLLMKRLKKITAIVSPERADINERLADLKAERAGIRVQDFSPEQKKQAGVVIIIGPSKVETRYGMVKPKPPAAKAVGKSKKAKTVTTTVAPPSAAAFGTGPAARETEEPDFTGVLKTELARHMGGALQMAIATKPQAAHYLLVASLLMRVMEDQNRALDLDQVISFNLLPWREAPSVFTELLTRALKPFKDGGGVTLADILAKLEALDHLDLMTLQAILLASALDINMNFMSRPAIATLIQRVDPDVGKYWQPDATFFGRLKKPDLIEALGEAAVPNIPKSGGKAPLVELAAAKLPATGWLPKPLRAPSYAGPGSNAWADRQGAGVADAVASETPAPAPIAAAAE